MDLTREMIVVTGGAGFVGSFIVEQLLKEQAGQIIILFPLATVFRILGVLLKGQVRLLSLSETERSAVQEVGNILASAFLSGLADLLGKRLMPSPPQLHVDNFPGLIQQVMADLEGEGSEVLVVEALFEDPGQLSAQLPRAPVEAFFADGPRRPAVLGFRKLGRG